jgi:hypothetical protein
MWPALLSAEAVASPWNMKIRNHTHPIEVYHSPATPPPTTTNFKERGESSVLLDMDIKWSYVRVEGKDGRRILNLRPLI